MMGHRSKWFKLWGGKVSSVTAAIRRFAASREPRPAPDESYWWSRASAATGRAPRALQGKVKRQRRMLHRSISYSLILGLGAVALAVLLFAVGPATDAGAQTAPGLGAASRYAVLGGQTVTNTGPTTIGGDVGVSPGTAVTGFPPAIVTGGTIHSADANALQAQSDVTGAYDDLAGQACTQSFTGTAVEMGGQTLTKGVYCFSSSAQLTGTLTLDAQGDASAVFVFKMGSTLTTASNSSVLVTNGSTGCNVFWQVGSSATIGTGTVFVGNILALTSIALNTGASVSGRALARNGAVTMDTNHVGFSGCAAPTATPVGQTPTPHITPSYLPGTGGPSSQGDQFPWTLLLAGLVASSLGASALVLGARARRRGAQQSGR